jgi:hypothetical protein
MILDATLIRTDLLPLLLPVEENKRKLQGSRVSGCAQEKKNFH